MSGKSSNNINLDLVKRLTDDVCEIGGSNIVLIDTPTTMVAKTNFFLLRGLLDIKKKKGFYVALDRPHQNMDYLLSNHGIDRDNIWYIDTVTHISGGEKVESRNVEFVDMSFEIENLMEVFEEDGNSKGSPSLDDVDFILLENLSAMMNYNSIESIEKFIECFDRVIHDHEDLMGCLVMDTNAHENLSEVVNGYLDKIIDVKKIKEEL